MIYFMITTLRESKMKRVFVKAFSVTNLGDDIFVKILCERYPQHRFYISASEEHDQAFQSIPNLTVLNRSTEKGKWIQRFQKWSKKIGLSIDFAIVSDWLFADWHIHFH